MTNNLGAPRIADSQADGQWATANDMTGRHDAAMTESLPVSFDSSDTVTLTALQFTSNHTFVCIAGSPAPDADCTLNVPNVNALAATLKRGAFTVINDLAQDLTIQVSGQSETPPELSPGQRSIMVMDGANVYVAVPSGTIGADGADGTDPGILFNFDTTTTDADPGNGDLRANNASLASATFLYIDDLDRSGNNVEAHLLTWDDSTNTPKGHLYLTRASDGAQAIFTTGAVTDASGYIKLAVTYVSGATSFSNADAISAQFYRAGNAGSAKVAQVVNTQTGTYATATALIPRDNTIPQNTEGLEVMTLAITSTDAGSMLLIEVVGHAAATNASRGITFALFQDTTAGALAVGTAFQAAGEACVKFTHKMTAGTTSPTTFKVRGGLSVSEAFHFNGNSGGATYGGTLASSITITEILP